MIISVSCIYYIKLCSSDNNDSDIYRQHFSGDSLHLLASVLLPKSYKTKQKQRTTKKQKSGKEPCLGVIGYRDTYRAFKANSYTVDSRYLEFQGTFWNTSRYPYLNISDLQNRGKINRTTAFNKCICNLIPEVRDILKILWKRGEIAPKEQFLLFSTIFCYLLLDFHV